MEYPRETPLTATELEDLTLFTPEGTLIVEVDALPEATRRVARIALGHIRPKVDNEQSV